MVGPAALLASAALLQGCVAAAAIPAVAAAGLIGRKAIAGNGDRDAYQPASDQKRQPQGNQALIVPSATPVASTPTPPPPPGVPTGMQFLYGSGEAAALSLQAYQALYSYLNTRAFDRKSGNEVAAVVLAQGATLADPKFAECGKKPLAAVFDIDETVVLNLGYEFDEAKRGTGYDGDRWNRWEATGGDRVEAVPGAVETIAAARRLGITIIFNTNRSAANADKTAAMLDRLGLGPAVHGQTLWLMGDGGQGTGKDERRWAIAQKYCVVAMVGDQLGDFTDLFNASAMAPNVRRNIATETMIAPLWGQGWFLLPNPVYGSGLKGSYDEVFPPARRWTDPGPTAQESAPAAPPPANPAAPPSAVPAKP